MSYQEYGQAKIIVGPSHPAVQKALVSFCATKTPSYSDHSESIITDSNFVLMTVTKRSIPASRKGKLSRETECRVNTLKNHTQNITTFIDICNKTS